MKRIARIVVMVTSAVCLAASAQERIPEPFLVTRVEIRLKGGCDRTGGEVWVVLDGADREVIPATASDTEKCVWTATAKRRFDARTRFLSVRFQGRRSDCKYAASIAVPRSQLMATYWFDWNETPAWDVKVDVAPSSVPVSYVRVVKRGLAPQDCIESAIAGDSPVRSVSFDRETFRLQPGRDKPDAKSAGRAAQSDGLGRKAETREASAPGLVKRASCLPSMSMAAPDVLGTPVPPCTRAAASASRTALRSTTLTVTVE